MFRPALLPAPPRPIPWPALLVMAALLLLACLSDPMAQALELLRQHWVPPRDWGSGRWSAAWQARHALRLAGWHRR